MKADGILIYIFVLFSTSLDTSLYGKNISILLRNPTLSTNSNFYIIATWWCNPLVFQTWTIWSVRIQESCKENKGISNILYVRFCKDISIRKLEFMAKT